MYLWTVEYLDKYLIYAAGQTNRPFIKRFREHTKAHKEGFFTIFDMEEMEQGHRKEIWHGFFTRKHPAEKVQEFKDRYEEIQKAVATQLAGFRVFVAPMEPDVRLLKRTESAIMNILYNSPAPASEIPDRGMSLSGRWENEEPVFVRNVGNFNFQALPEEFEI